MLDNFEEIWLVDFEFRAPEGERPEPVCMVAMEYRTMRTVRLWWDDLLRMPKAPFRTDKCSLVVAYYASAEIGCFLTLGWPLPVNLIDLYPEFRTLTNGRTLPAKSGLIGALRWFGHGTIDVTEKDEMRELAMRQGEHSGEEKAALIEYCKSDVIALRKILYSMRHSIHVPRALLRGKYMAAAAQIEALGIPIDISSLERLRKHWETIKTRLITEVDKDYGVYEGNSFKSNRFATWVAQQGIQWPLLPSGTLDMKEDTFKEMARIYPELNALRELRSTLSQMRLSTLAVGGDGRNRCMLSAFRSKTGRNQPSNAKYIFGPAVWMRSLIQPSEGRGIAYIDWSQQEFGIAAALSGDPLMQQAYSSGDPYLEFAKQAKAIPADATKASHGQEREMFKACVLAVQYGMGAESLASKIKQDIAAAAELLNLHRGTYCKYWQWSEGALEHAMLLNHLYTVCGWALHIEGNTNPRSLQNFPMQANGAEMLRLACILGIQEGVSICAPVHDAILIEAPLDRLDQHIIHTQAIMAEASRVILNGFELRSEAKIVRHPDRYMDERGAEMWTRIMRICDEIEYNTPCMGDTPLVHI